MFLGISKILFGEYSILVTTLKEINKINEYWNIGLVVVKGKTSKSFWKNKKGGIQFSHLEFSEFCGQLGFVISDNGQVMKISSSNNSVYLVYSWENIHGYITSFLTNTNPEYFEGG